MVASAALSGFLVTLLFVLLSIFPVIDFENPWHYSLKVASVLLGLTVWLGSSIALETRESRVQPPLSK